MNKQEALQEARDASTSPARLVKISGDYYATEEIALIFQSNPAFWRRLGYQTYEEAAHPLGHQVWKMRKSLTIESI